MEQGNILVMYFNYKDKHDVEFMKGLKTDIPLGMYNVNSNDVYGFELKYAPHFRYFPSLYAEDFNPREFMSTEEVRKFLGEPWDYEELWN